MLPKINSTRSKIFKINNKSFLLKTWSNNTLVHFESLSEDGNLQEMIKEHLILPFVETKDSMSLLEERLILLELYKLSKSNLLDVKYTCNECNTESNYVITLDKAYNYYELKSRVIKTKDFIFNLRVNSNYRVNIAENKYNETIKYLASYIDSFKYKDETFEVTDLEETYQWLLNELDEENFNELVLKFSEVQPSIDIKVVARCEHCNNLQDLNFRGVEHFLK